MHAKTELTPAQGMAITQAEVVDAAFSTLQMLLPHAARVVEQKTQLLVEQVGALLTATRAQESTIAQLVACLQHLRSMEHDLSVDEWLNRTQVSLAFSLEHNLQFDRDAQQWGAQLESSIAHLRALEEALERNGPSGNAEWQRGLQQARQQLLVLHAAIGSGGMDARERALYHADMKTVRRVLQEQPERTRQLQALLEDANCNARAIGEHARAAVMAIQFQDYNSQLAENALRLLTLLRGALVPASPHADGADMLAHCRDALSMGEIRHMLMQNLKHHPDLDRDYRDLGQGAVELF